MHSSVFRNYFSCSQSGGQSLIQICSFRFDGYESYQTALEQWSPESARKSNESRSNGKLAYFSINCFSEKLFAGKVYVGFENASKHFVSSDVKNENEIGSIAVLVFDRVSSGAYRNGATAWQCVCKIYLLDKDTLAVFAEGKVYGPEPPSTTSGGDRVGEKPSIVACKKEAQRLFDDLG